MRTKIVIVIFLLSIICWSKTLTVNTDSPYKNGIITIIQSSSSLNQEFNFDTIAFSNGISFSFFNQTSLIPEGAFLFHGIKIDTAVYLAKAGFKYLQTAHWESDSTVKAYINNDTDWSSAKKYPDSLVKLDSLNDLSNISNKIGFGKWLYFNNAGTTPTPFSNAGSSINFKTIIYLSTNNIKMKLQCTNVIINPIYPNNFNFLKVDSLKIRWMIDSLGNGNFDVPSKTQKHPEKINKSPKKINHKIGLGNSNKSWQSGSVYSIKGERIFGINSIKMDKVVIFK